MVLAQNPFPFGGIGVPVSGGKINPDSATLGDVITVLVPYIFAGAGLILLLNLIYGGISMMLSRGDPKAIEGARGRITASLIGFVIIFTAYWIVQIAAAMLGIQSIKGIFQ